MSEKQIFDFGAGIFIVMMFLAVLYTVNYELPTKNNVYINSDGFNLGNLSVKAGDYLNIYNNDTVIRKIVINGLDSPEISPQGYIQYKLVNTGTISLEIRDKQCTKSNITIEVN